MARREPHKRDNSTWVRPLSSTAPQDVKTIAFPLAHGNPVSFVGRGRYKLLLVWGKEDISTALRPDISILVRHDLPRNRKKKRQTVFA